MQHPECDLFCSEPEDHFLVPFFLPFTTILVSQLDLNCACKFKQSKHLRITPGCVHPNGEKWHEKFINAIWWCPRLFVIGKLCYSSALQHITPPPKAIEPWFRLGPFTPRIGTCKLLIYLTHNHTKSVSLHQTNKNRVQTSSKTHALHLLLFSLMASWFVASMPISHCLHCAFHQCKPSNSKHHHQKKTALALIKVARLSSTLQCSTWEWNGGVAIAQPTTCTIPSLFSKGRRSSLWTFQRQTLWETKGHSFAKASTLVFAIVFCVKLWFVRHPNSKYKDLFVCCLGKQWLDFHHTVG